MIDWLVVVAVVVWHSIVAAWFIIRQHRKTKNAALHILDHAWSLYGEKENGRNAIWRVRGDVARMTLGDTLNQSAKEQKHVQ